MPKDKAVEKKINPIITGLKRGIKGRQKIRKTKGEQAKGLTPRAYEMLLEETPASSKVQRIEEGGRHPA